MADADAAAIRRPAPAKLNLFLNITGRRDDGMHLLESLFAFLNIGDQVRVRPADALSLEAEGPFAGALPAQERNLAYRAAVALAKRTGRAARARIELEKNLPIASGIGGGSADAAAALNALCDLWRIDPDDVDLATLAGELGADVPACLISRTVFATGVGERLKPLAAVPPLALLLANPGVSVDTGDVYRGYCGPFTASAPLQELPTDLNGFAELLRDRGNDLTKPAIALAPVIAETLEMLTALPGAVVAQMSGSGATCFAVFSDRRAAANSARQLNEARPRWWIRTAMLAGGSC